MTNVAGRTKTHIGESYKKSLDKVRGTVAAGLIAGAGALGAYTTDVLQDTYVAERYFQAARETGTNFTEKSLYLWGHGFKTAPEKASTVVWDGLGLILFASLMKKFTDPVVEDRKRIKLVNRLPLSAIF